MTRGPLDPDLPAIEPDTEAPPRGDASQGSPLDRAELEAAVRFVVGSVPHLALALVWLVALAPDVAEEMTRVKVSPSHLAELADLDEAFAVLVAASPEARIRRSGAWLDARSDQAEVEPGAAEDEAVREAAEMVVATAGEQPGVVRAILALVVRDHRLRLALRTYTPTPEERRVLAEIITSWEDAG